MSSLQINFLKLYVIKMYSIGSMKLYLTLTEGKEKKCIQFYNVVFMDNKC